MREAIGLTPNSVVPVLQYVQERGAAYPHPTFETLLSLRSYKMISVVVGEGTFSL